MMDFLSGRFAELQGLPLHPLVVHLVVILVPLSAVAMLVAIAVPKWRSPLQWIALTGLVVGGLGTYLAKLSGDSLAAAVGLPTFHAEWGNNMVPLVAALMALSGLWIWLNHLTKWRPARRVVAGIVGLLAVSSVAMTYVVGHSGAEAVWQDTLTDARQAPASAAEASNPISLSEVAQHNTPEDCWTAVDGQVYDLTDFIARHPAGPAGVAGMCGKDATESFNGEHAGQAEPESWLAVFRIGEVA